MLDLRFAVVRSILQRPSSVTSTVDAANTVPSRMHVRRGRFLALLRTLPC